MTTNPTIRHRHAEPAADRQGRKISRRPRLRRRTLTAAGLALFLAGLLFGEAIEAVADIEEQQVVETAVATTVVPQGPAFRQAQAFQADRDQQVVEAVSVELFQRLHTALLLLADEGISLERREIWNVLADCESGDWYRGVPIEGSRRWDSTAGYFEGGLQFDPRTWDGFRDPDMPSAAYDATPIQQMVVAERVLEAQGWRAWPVCSRKVGYR